VSDSSRLAILADFKEEGWPSMDLVAEMLASHSIAASGAQVKGTLIQPPYRRWMDRMPVIGRRGFAINLDRFYNRFAIYPRFAKGLVGDFDFFHVADHSYGALVHSLPVERTGVYCHDLDAFRCLLKPKVEPRPRWFRKMARHILAGMQKAAVVFHNSLVVRAELLRFGLVDEARLVHAPLGVANEFTHGSTAANDFATGRSNASHQSAQAVVHVGSCIPRKRIDVLIDTFARVREVNPRARLIKVGGSFTEDHHRRIASHALEPFIEHRQGLSRSELADVYRSASVVLVPSEAEGFGLPVIEALACGAPVIASDIPVLREVGGDVVGYAPVGDIDRWASLTTQVLDDPSAIATRDQRLAHVSQYTWARHAEIIAQAYLQLV
jgi:glycosyltransferase involved in cell wall biosynthesis